MAQSVDCDLMCVPTRFREPAARGPYLWDWGNECGLEGLGYAPTSMSGHHFITLAALRVLPEAVAWLRGEARLLTWTYCGFPDMNWAQYGTFGTEVPGARMPDTRREWEISRYCRYNQLLNEGHFIGHHPKQAIEGLIGRYEDACRSADAGRARDAVRFLGAAIHYLEDSGSPPHAAAVGGPMHMPAESLRYPSRITIAGYQPAVSLDPQVAVDHLEAFGIERCRPIVALLEEGRPEDILPHQLACANECARAVADLVNQFFIAYHGHIDFLPRRAPVNVELLHNSDFATPGDATECPDGWVMYWEDRADTRAVAERVATPTGAEIAIVDATERVACQTTWPRVVRGVAGQAFLLTGEVLCSRGEAGLEAVCTDDATCPVAEFNKQAQGSGSWERLELAITMPEGGEILRPGVYARGLEGSARFRRLSLVAR